MTVQRIAGADDPRVALYRSVADPELARTHALFVAEGRLVVRRAIANARYRIQSLLLNDAAHRDLEAALSTLDGEVPIYVCDTAAFVQVTGFNIHRGCLALVERPPDIALDDLLVRARSPLVVLEAVANPDNVGGVFRNAAAFGAGGVVLSPTCCDPFYRKAIRTSMGAALTVPFARAHRWPGAIDRIRAAGFAVVALTPREPAEPLDTFIASRETARAVALVAGAEGAGLSEAVEAAADHRVRIPISDDVDSLNVAVAVGIALWAVVYNEPRI